MSASAPAPSSRRSGNPIKLAGEAALADIVTGGRLELGLARGAYSFEYERLSPGLDAASAGAALREAVPAVKKLWQGDYAHDGERWQFPKTTSSPKPVQRPHPPLWIAARDPDSHKFAVAEHCNVQVTPLWQGDDEVERLMQRFEDACAAYPEIPRPRIMLLRHTHVGADEEAVAEGARALSRFYCHFGAWFRNERPVSQGMIQPLTDAEMAALDMFSPEADARQQCRRHAGAGGRPAQELRGDGLRPIQPVDRQRHAVCGEAGVAPPVYRRSGARFRMSGAATGRLPAAVLVHGVGLDRRMWDGVSRCLPAGCAASPSTCPATARPGCRPAR